MGKLKKISPKKADNKQSKISLFFQGQAASKPFGRKESPLFSTVQSSNKSKLSLKKDFTKSSTAQKQSTNQNATSEAPEVKSTNNTEATKSPVSKASSENEGKLTVPVNTFPLKFAASTGQSAPSANLDKDGTTEKRDAKKLLFQASQIIKSITGEIEEPELDEHITCVPETQLDDSFTSPPPKTHSKMEAQSSDKKDSDNELGDVIPGTPQEKVIPKKKTYRSFLSGRTDLVGKNTLHHKLKQQERTQQKSKPNNSKQQKPTGRSLEDALKSVENDLEFASAESFNAMLTGVGFGQAPIIPKKENSHERKGDETTLKHRAGAADCISGAKRLSACGASPNAKRVMRKTPVKRLSPKQKLNVENRGANRVKKFTRNLSTSYSTNFLGKKDNFPKDSAEKNINLDADDDLSDLLQTYQPKKTPQSMTSKSKLKSTPNQDKAPHHFLESDLEDKSTLIPAHDEPDEALDDIISELRDTLTQSNSKNPQFKAKLERSILSEGVSPQPLQAVKRRISIDDQIKTVPVSKCGRASDTGEPGSNKMEVDAVTKQEELMISDSLDCALKDMDSEPIPSVSPKPQHDGSNMCNELDMSDLQFDEAELAAEENLRKEFSALSPFKERTVREPEYSIEKGQSPCVHFGRCRVKEIIKSDDEVLVELLTDPGGQHRQATLHGFWTEVAISEGDIVHVVGKFDASGKITISNKENLLIVHPDLLISGTSVVSGIFCMRRAVLNERFKGFDSANIYMLYGTIIHSFFQKVVQTRQNTPKVLERAMKSVMEQPRVLHDMYGQGVPAASVEEEIKKYIPQLQLWVERYLPANKQPQKNTNLTISKIADIEENVWSPRYGIKGKIDLTVEVKVHDRGKGTSSTTKLMPLELKTGRPSHSAEHKGQVTLYSMMSGDRRADPEAGLLLYLKDGSMTTVPADHANKRGLVQLRNELAHHVSQTVRSVVAESGSGLPRPINSARACSKCPQLINCTAYQQTMGETPVGSNHSMSKLIPETLGHLSECHLEFYRRWIKLMMLELSTERSTSTNVADLWCRTGWQREKDGLCLSGMLLVPTNESAVPTQTGHFYQIFRRMHSHPNDIHLNDVGIAVRENLVVSAENEPLIALTMGTVTALTDDSITLLLDRDLHLIDPAGRLVYRLDKADTYNSMASNMNNLARLMENSEISARLREVVIEKKTPEFEMTMSKGVIDKVKTIFKKLNRPQKTAILKVLMCKDYVLIKGYPGTGKTSTIVSLVRILVLLGRSVLLTSYTHSAVDNILLKLMQHDTDFVRLGRAERIHPKVKPYSAELQTLRMKDVDQLSAFYESKSIVATTCLGVGSHPIFIRRQFDVCIVDEASQVLQPACLGPLFASSRFVLVGDPLQLPPVVQSKKAREGGMDESLFARLDGAGGTYELNFQYRMNSDIMRLSNELVYKGALSCGNELVANRQLELPNGNILQAVPVWVQAALKPEARVIFLDTSQIPVVEEAKSTNIQNPTEAQLVTVLAKCCVKAGMAQDELGVITPYRCQVALVHDLLQRNRLLDVEVNTVDQYQGRDKNCIIISFVKNTPGKASGILEDLRRLNVALTRARHKLIMIGHKEVLAGYSPLKAVLDILTFGQMLQLPSDAVASSNSDYRAC